VDKSYSRRLALNSAIFKNLYWVLPVDDVGHENYIPVGRGVKSSPLCGKWIGIAVCKNVEGHEGLSLNGEDATGKVVARHKHLWCHRSLCPVCFIRGWSVRGARSVENRLEEGVRLGFGKIEHIVVSINPKDYGLDEKDFRVMARSALVVRGVYGGCMIFHGYSMNKMRTALVWQPHYHALGFVLGGFDRCRNCVHMRGDCASCDGFKGREVREYANDKIIVKVLADRETVFGTAFYQLNHSTVRIGVKRFHTNTWFGVCGNRKYATPPKFKSVDKCPVCDEEMVRSVYVGKRHLVKDVSHSDYEAVSLFNEFGENGEPNFIDYIR